MKQFKNNTGLTPVQQSRVNPGDKPTKILVFGNPRVKFDSLPLKILPKLRKQFPDIKFVLSDPTEIINYSEEELWILDTVQGINNVKLIVFTQSHLRGGLGRTPRVLSVHDYDLALDLNLLLKLGKVKKIKILAIPQNITKQEAQGKISKLLRAT